VAPDLYLGQVDTHNPFRSNRHFNSASISLKKVWFLNIIFVSLHDWQIKVQEGN